MRILITVDPEIPVPPLTYGGIERIVDWLARGLERRGHIVGLVANKLSTCEVNTFFKWSVNSSRLFPDGVVALKQLSKYASEFRPDIIHSFSRIAYLLGAFFTDIALVMSYQRYPTIRSVKIASAIFAKRLRFTACSEFIADIGRKAGGVWSCIYNGVDLDKYNFSVSVPSDAPLVFLSRIEPIKGAHIAIQIAKKSGRKLVIAGNYPKSGLDLEYWNQKIRPEIDGKLIEYVGQADDSLKNKLLSSALALLVPVQWEEPFGIVFAESLACGTPVISCPYGALPEIIKNAQNGFLIKNTEQGVEAVNKVHEISRLFCRKVAEEKFSSHVLIDQYEKLYDSLL